MAPIKAKTVSMFILTTGLVLSSGRAQADVGLQYGFFSKRPTHFRTALIGNVKTSPQSFREAHSRSPAPDLTVRWHTLPASQHCLDSLEEAHLDRVAATTNHWLQRLGSFPNRSTRIDIYLVPQGSGLHLKAPIHRRGSDATHIEYGVRMACGAPGSAVTQAGYVLVHEAVHVPLLKQNVAIVSNEAVAYTTQTCARLDMDGHLPGAASVSHTLPQEMMEFFRVETPRRHLERYTGMRGASTKGGILAQMNLGLFLGLTPIEAADDPRAESLRQYCDCVLEHTPDFESIKPGEIWQRSNETGCSLE